MLRGEKYFWLIGCTFVGIDKSAGSACKQCQDKRITPGSNFGNLAGWAWQLFRERNDG
jgi:hypothetical protein